MIWYNRLPTDVRLTDIYPRKQVGNPANDIATVLDFSYAPDRRGAFNYSQDIGNTLTPAKNWAGVMKELKAAGYQGWVAAEMIPPVPFYKHCPEVLIHNTSRAMDAIFAL